MYIRVKVSCSVSRNPILVAFVYKGNSLEQYMLLSSFLCSSDYEYACSLFPAEGSIRTYLWTLGKDREGIHRMPELIYYAIAKIYNN